MPRFALSAVALLWGALPAVAAPCGDTAAGFEAWKPLMAQEAAAAGIGPRGIEALMDARYAEATIAADRNQSGFRFSLDRFMAVRGADTIVAQARRRKARNADAYASLERRFGVPAGVILAIHGMETAFGTYMGESNVVSAVATLAYDCRRSDFFTGHLVAALRLVDEGTITPATLGAKHGEIGHTQFLPGNVLRYGIDGDGDGRVDLSGQTDALASTANFLAQKGWRPGLGYQPGEPNFAVLQEWNAAHVYQQAIALMAARIDG